ncbi:LssY C-terminus [Granulicatella balaenopterae]|uniref:LssY C-terminus n=1 Tax=Granulicatella balaenopterae TaxID=137733 RepID=A0A1H9MLG5_9LACT|nr:LssY C-terminal domain-containing protein [Granulicatella balaenopterae]SER24544.1 LssY C-terminus [Granulicatella balaenopterae]
MKEYSIPKQKPTYHYVKKTKKRKPRIYLLIDRLFTVYGFILAFIYTVLLLIASFKMKGESLVFFFLFWCMLTYITLPRLHSFLTMIYLPDYFLSRTKTGNGVLGDPVNISIVAKEDDIHAAMRQAGWTKADPITIRSSLGIVLSTLKHTSYPAAPVSNLYLFDRPQDFAYQMEVDGSATRRHHVRFWQVPKGWHLPGGKKVDYLAAGTFDCGVGLASTTLQVTHKIDQEVDKERDYIIESLLYMDSNISVDVIQEFTIPYQDENGGGDPIKTDGHMPIINLLGVSQRAKARDINLEQVDDLKISKNNKTLNQELPPKSLLYIGLFSVIKMVMIILVLLLLVMTNTPDYQTDLMIGLSYLFGTLVNLVLYSLTVKKYKWSRLIFLVMASISCSFELVTSVVNLELGLFDLFSIGFSVMVVVILSSPDIRQWVYHVHRRGE